MTAQSSTRKNSAGRLADDAESVAAIYEKGSVAASYLDKRTQWAWQRLMHWTQVRAVNRAIERTAPGSVLELAPGPARLTTEVTNVRRGVLVENSAEMIAIAGARLRERGLAEVWRIVCGDAFELGGVLGSEVFDLAYTFRFIRHFREPERRQLYAALRGQLRVGGLLLFDVVNSVVREALDANAERPSDSLDVYDVGYTPDSFAAEMDANGFKLIELTPVIKHFALQAALSTKLRRLPMSVADRLVSLLDRIPASQPLEWVALCEKR